jgi:hypothetical protein
MEMLAFVIGSSLPLTVLVFAGSYFGIWKRSGTRLPWIQVLGLFVMLWIVTAALSLLVGVTLPGEDVARLWIPLVVGIVIGRTVIGWISKTKMAAE